MDRDQARFELQRLVAEASKIAPSIVRFDERRNYGTVTDENFDGPSFARWDVEAATILEQLSKSTPVFRKLHAEYLGKKKTSKKFHSRSILVHEIMQILVSALQLLDSSLAIPVHQPVAAIQEKAVDSKPSTKPESPVGKIIVAVVIALLVGSSSPWWWDKVFHTSNKAVTSPECSPDALRNQLLHADSDKPAVIKYSARTMRQRFNLQDIDCVLGLATVLIEVNQDNGHGLYYSGEAWRAKAKQEPTRANFFREQMRAYFFRYLDAESSLTLGERDGDGAACYQREKGYCAERTAWINHLMAIDYYQQAQDTVDKEVKMHHLQRALKFVNKDLNFGGFDQILPSRVLKLKIQEELARDQQARREGR